MPERSAMSGASMERPRTPPPFFRHSTAIHDSSTPGFSPPRRATAKAARRTRASRSRSEQSPVLEPRERRTIAIASAVLGVAVLVAYGILPFARRWNAREELIATRAEQVARLEWLAEHEPELRRATADRL